MDLTELGIKLESRAPEVDAITTEPSELKKKKKTETGDAMMQTKCYSYSSRLEQIQYP